MERSRTYPVAQADTFDWLLGAPLPPYFGRRFAIIPGIRDAVIDDGGPWERAGQVRTLHLSDGTTLREHLLTVERPRRFSYRLTDVTGPLKLLADGVDGSWTCEPVGTGTRVTWRWDLHATSTVSARLVPLFARIWQGYARQALDAIEPLLVSAVDPGAERQPPDDGIA